MEPEKTTEPEKTPRVETIKLVEQHLADNIAIHQKTLREQLMIQWPNSNWEIREE